MAAGTAGANAGGGGRTAGVDDDYESFAADYHWVHPPDATEVGTFERILRPWLHGLEPGAAVLDAACGTGLDAVVLAGRGLRVTATDSSASMVAATRRRVAAEGADVEVLRADWRELADRLRGRRFDAVLCTGNSISHLDGPALGQALGQFAELLAPAALLVLDTHHWEEVLEAGDRTVVDPDVVEIDGVRCRRSYHWRVPAPGAADQRCELCFELKLSDAAGEWTRSHPVSFHPFRVGDLLGAIRSAGLAVEFCDAVAGSDRYRVVARSVGVAHRRGPDNRQHGTAGLA